MKKVISLILVFLIVFAVTACDNTNENNSPNVKPNETLPLDIEKLQNNWKEGELIFDNGDSILLPCVAKDFIEVSELEVYNSQYVIGITLSPGEVKSVYLVNDETRIEITCENTTDENVNIMDSTVVKYNFTNVKPGNRKIKFAGSLTAGVTRADVETALEIPKDATSEDSLYFYSGRNSNNKRVELRIGFNSDNIVSSVSFEVNA